MLPYVCVTYVEHGSAARRLVDHLETVPVVLGVVAGRISDMFLRLSLVISTCSRIGAYRHASLCMRDVRGAWLGVAVPC